MRRYFAPEPTSVGITLPTELWIPIVEGACRPTVIIGDEPCPPDMIETFVKWQSGDSLAPEQARRFIRSSKRRLRAVCRLWRQIADAMINENFISTVFISPNLKQWTPKSMDGGPGRTIPRLIVRLRDGAPTEPLKHSRPVSSLTLEIKSPPWGNGGASLDGVLSIISYPSSLRSLSLNISGFQAQTLPDSLLDPLAFPEIPLCNLSLKTPVYGCFHSNLTFQHLTTLSLSIIAPIYTGSRPHPTSWNLPLLKNLSIDCVAHMEDTPMIGFVSHLFADYSTQLRSLRLKGSRNLGINIASPSFWASLARLEVFATDFTWFLCDQRDLSMTEGAIHAVLEKVWPRTLSIRHLIQIGSAFPSVFTPGLTQAIEHCPKLDTVSLAPSAPEMFGGFKKMRREEYVATSRIQRLCKLRGAQILDAEGSEIHDIVEEDGFR